MAEIVIENADGTRQRYRVTKDPRDHRAGRRGESEHLPARPVALAHHAEIQRRDGLFFLLDLGSKNGTLLNGERVRQQCRLQQGDVIALGEHHLTFSGDGGDDDYELQGTRIFSARDLSEIKTQPTTGAEGSCCRTACCWCCMRTQKELLEHRPLPELFDKLLELLFEAVPAQRAAILLHEGRHSSRW
jgi:hypothetical protein